MLISVRIRLPMTCPVSTEAREIAMVRKSIDDAFSMVTITTD